MGRRQAYLSRTGTTAAVSYGEVPAAGTEKLTMAVIAVIAVIPCDSALLGLLYDSARDVKSKGGERERFLVVVMPVAGSNEYAAELASPSSLSPARRITTPKRPCTLGDQKSHRASHHHPQH